ncbi:hypothetical protein FGRMN_5089 [Fusarium graminum]|nr:hypothetical protein FGRMN_5089 [Fusarium graminum]
MLKTLFERPQDIGEKDVTFILSLATRTWFKDEPASTLDWFNESTVSTFVKAIHQGALNGLNLAPRLRHGLLISACHIFSMLDERDDDEDTAIQIVRCQYKMVHYCDAQPDDRTQCLDPSLSGTYIANGLRAAMELASLIQMRHEAGWAEHVTALESIFQALKRIESAFVHGESNRNGDDEDEGDDGDDEDEWEGFED